MSMPLSRLLGAALLVFFLVSCSRPPQLVGVDNATHPVAAQKQTVKRKVFIATTREATEAVGAFYSAQRAPDLGFASVVVSIPPTHVSGAIERPKRLPPDPATEFAVIEPTIYGSDSVFLSQLNRALEQLPPKDRQLLLFVHGYNNTISDSILRIAQFAEDSGFTGIPVLFSWASAAKTTHYVYDLNSVLAARPKLNDLGALLRRSRATGVSVFAHSMGTMLTMEAIVQAEIAGTYNQLNLIDNIMLAAPDIDIDVFRSQLSFLSERERNFYVFVSSKDKALGFSRRISGGVERVGASSAEELAPLGVTVIDLSQVSDSAAGAHSTFAGSPEVVQLIGKGLSRDTFDERPQAPTLVEVLGGVPVLRVLVE